MRRLDAGLRWVGLTAITVIIFNNVFDSMQTDKGDFELKIKEK